MDLILGMVVAAFGGIFLAAIHYLPIARALQVQAVLLLAVFIAIYTVKYLVKKRYFDYWDNPWSRSNNPGGGGSWIGPGPILPPSSEPLYNPPPSTSTRVLDGALMYLCSIVPFFVVDQGVFVSMFLLVGIVIILLSYLKATEWE